MFSLTTSVVNSQMALPIYNLSQFSFYRPMPKRCSSYSKNKGKQSISHQIDSIQNRTITEICARLNLNKADKDIAKQLRQCALHGPQKQSVTFTQTREYSQLLAKRNLWHESHTSHNTFSENKVETPSKKVLFNDLSKNWRAPSPILLVARSFKTKRGTRTYEPLMSSFDSNPQESRGVMSQITGESKQKPLMSSFDSNPQESRGVMSQITGEPKQKLASLLENEPLEESQKKIKVAFAEGYISGGSGKSNKYQSIFSKAILVGVPLGILLYFARKSKFFSLDVSMYDKEINPMEINVKFDDVQGAEEAKQELQEVVEFLKNPEKYTVLGAELPKGVLLVGPPGTGKTLLARAVAGEAKVPFFHAAGAEFDEVLVGQGARRVRQLFNSAKRKAPCVLFIDEVDSVGGKRTSSVLHPYANQTINQLLAEMDGFVQNEGVIVLGATNRRENLDPALLRPGRFDVEIQVPVPDLSERKQLFNFYLNKIKCGKDVDVDVLSLRSTGFTGADIKNMVNQAALRAATDEVDKVSMMYLEQASDKVMMGPEKKSRIPDEEANLIVAYHEGGHTIVSYFTKDSRPLHKVTIIPRGRTLGFTAFIPSEKEQYHMTRSQMLAQMDALMGGRAAEEVIYGYEKLTAGAAQDLRQATLIAKTMVKVYGMSDKVGLRTYGKGPDEASASTKETIDTEIKNLLQESYERAKTILKTHTKEHKALADALMKYETLDANDVKIILEGRPLSKNF